ncbi:MAG: PPC domain-containing protein [Planctomycetaceae bacterium]
MLHQPARSRLALATALLLAMASPAATRAEYPMLMSLQPVAAQLGQTSEHTVSSRYNLYGAYQVLVSGTKVTATVVAVPKTKDGKTPSLTSLKLKFTVAADALPGVRDFRLATPRGASTIGQIVIVADPIVNETGNNNSTSTAQTITLPATICGAIEKAEDVDVFKFTATKGQPLSFHVRSQRLQDRIHDLQKHVDPILTLRTAAGTTLAASDNYFFADPFLAITAPADGQYTLEIRDVRYQGNGFWQYSIQSHNRPVIETVHPLAVATGTDVLLAPIGHHLGSNTSLKIHLPADSQPGRSWQRLELAAGISNPVQVVASRLPTTVEAATDNNDPQSAQTVTVPSTVSGRIGSESDIDCYVFEAKKGETFTFEVIARRAGSALDSHLRILDATGKQLALNDDLTRLKRLTQDSKFENFTVPADGKYVIELRDVHLRGGPRHVYAIRTTRSVPYFELFLDSDKTQLSPGTSGVIFVRVERHNGFGGAIDLQVDGLPNGVTASCGRILADGDDGCIILSAPAKAELAISNITVTGTEIQADDSSSGPPLADVARPMQETYMPGGGRNHWPVFSHAVNVGTLADIRSVTLSTTSVTLKPGTSATIKVHFERAPGFTKNVTLDVLYRHLGSVYGNPLPKGVTIDAAASKTLITGKASDGQIVLKAAADAPPIAMQQVSVMANVSINFVMKATYSSPPLMVTVAKP